MISIFQCYFHNKKERGEKDDDGLDVTLGCERFSYV